MVKAQNRSHVDIENARKDDQREVMRAIEDADHCPFCLENLRTYHKEPILREGSCWIVTRNQWPYDHTQHHFLLILKRHTDTLRDLTPDEGAELFAHLSWLESEYEIPGGGLGMRFGNTDYSAGSVNHLHAQLIVPDIDDPDFESVRLKIGKQWAKR